MAREPTHGNPGHHHARGLTTYDQGKATRRHNRPVFKNWERQMTAPSTKISPRWLGR
jgi:hypothetical protein